MILCIHLKFLVTTTYAKVFNLLSENQRFFLFLDIINWLGHKALV